MVYLSVDYTDPYGVDLWKLSYGAFMIAYVLEYVHHLPLYSCGEKFNHAPIRFYPHD